MSKKKGNLICNTMLSSIINEGTMYIANIERIVLDNEFKESKTYAVSESIIKEIAQALQKKQKLTDVEIDAYEKDTFKVYQDIEKLSSMRDIDGNNSDTLIKNGAINEALLLCKKQGVYPFFISKLAAAAFYYHVQEKQSEVYGGVLRNGLKTSIKEICSFENEPELVYLIVEAYKTIIVNKFFDVDNKRLEFVKSAFKVAFENEAVYGGCSQCLIKSFFTITNKTDENSKYLFKAASPLSGGIACCNDSACGAYTGTMMVIGTYVGRELKDLDDVNGETGEKGNDIGRYIHDKFIETYGSLTCGQIHKNIFNREFNFRNDNDMKAFKDAGAHADKCPMVVGMANTWLCEALYDEGLLNNKIGSCKTRK